MEHDIELEDIGWKVLRQRQVHLEKLLLRAIRTSHEAAGRVVLLDLALGSGRQVLEVIRSLPDYDIRAEVRDLDAGNLEKGRQLANKLGVTRISFERKDAFDDSALHNLDADTNVVVAAGIFELTSDNNKIEHTLSALAETLSPDSLLVYTDQPLHPHLEMIGRVAVQREESPWAMRRRSADEMDALVAKCGFEQLERLTDEHGLFSVGLARRP